LAAKENTRLLQIGAINEAVNDAALPTVEDDKVALLSLCDKDHTELQFYAKMIEVYDKARSHFLFEIVELQVKRYLNAERLKAEAEADPRVLLYSDYKELFLEQTQSSESTQDLISYILKPREEGCPIYLWAAERILESLTMSDPAWLACTLAFITPEERQVLQVPSLAADLETAFDVMDVTTIKRFRQAACTDPVAVQALGLNRAKEGSMSAPRKPKFIPCTNPVSNESYPAELAPKPGKGKNRNHP
jgi:hypothetical protein